MLLFISYLLNMHHNNVKYASKICQVIEWLLLLNLQFNNHGYKMAGAMVNELKAMKWMI